MKQKLIIILGPTGIGKTELVLALAQAMGGEIVSADSVQVYRYMDIGSAKPSAETRSLVPHYVIDVVNPDEEFSAGRFREEAQRAIASIVARRKPVIVSGGTGLYIKALMRGLFPQPEGDEKFRRGLRSQEKAEGKGFLYARLEEVDPESAAKIHRNDLFRTIRALEVYHLTGTALSQHHGNHRFGESSYDCLQIGLHLDREQLYERINQRCDQMMGAGFLDEVRSLLDRGYHGGLKSMQALGYRHLCRYVEGSVDLDEAVRLMKRDTRHYAKRQMTWFGSDPDVVWVYNSPEAIDDIGEMVQRFFSGET